MMRRSRKKEKDTDEIERLYNWQTPMNRNVIINTSLRAGTFASRERYHHDSEGKRKTNSQ